MYYKKDYSKLQDIQDDIRHAKKGIKTLIDDPCYRAALGFARKVIQHQTPLLSEHRAWGDQIYRSATSITANIAEGIGRGTDGQLVQFLRIARGSAYETVAWLQLAPAELDSVKDELVKGCLAVVKSIEDSIVAASTRKAAEYGGFTE